MIGGGAVILPGVKIGAGALAGAATLVTKDVPAGAIVISPEAGVSKSWGSEPFDWAQDKRRLSSVAYRNQASGFTDNPLGLDTSLRSYSTTTRLVSIRRFAPTRPALDLAFSQ